MYMQSQVKKAGIHLLKFFYLPGRRCLQINFLGYEIGVNHLLGEEQRQLDGRCLSLELVEIDLCGGGSPRVYQPKPGGGVIAGQLERNIVRGPVVVEHEAIAADKLDEKVAVG